MTPKVEKVFIGGVKHLGDTNAKDKLDQPWSTAAYKEETEEAVYLTKEGLEGDAVADTRYHGGTEKALFAYSVHHYATFSEMFHQNVPVGSNGENVALSDIDESTVCIGDVYQIGEALVEVSQPRRPCWKPGRRIRVIEFGKQLQETGYTGWYFRVLKEGNIQAGNTLELQQRPYPDWSIQRINECLYHEQPQSVLEALLHAPFLPTSWQATIEKKINRIPEAEESRLYGPNV